MKYNTKSEKETEKLGAQLIQKLTEKQDGPIILALTGELGSGKTTLVKGIAKELGIEKNITSPTFLILKKYPLQKQGFNYLFHVDTYRLDSGEDLKKLDIENILRQEKNIIIIEWADKVPSLVPSSATNITLKHGKQENERAIIVNEDNDEK